MNNTDNWMSLLRSSIKIIGAVVATLGFASAGQVEAVSTAVITTAGGMITLVGLFLSLWQHTPDVIVAVKAS